MLNFGGVKILLPPWKSWVFLSALVGLIPLAERISFVGAAELVDKKNVGILYRIDVPIGFMYAYYI